ncbi:MAG TPA: cytochrome c [Longimicrobiales bacterium]
MRQRLALLGGALAVMLIAAGAWLGFVYSGFYNVAASEPHSSMVEWTLETISERSVRRRADELPAPLPVDSASLQHGFDHYRLMCEVCHGGVGVERSEIAEGLSPRPPRLARAARSWTDAELFWITKHGIKATGMPAFGATHDDASLLQIVAVVRRLPEMSEAEYAARTRAGVVTGVDHEALMDDSVAAGPAPAAAAGGHSHAPGTPAHAH